MLTCPNLRARFGDRYRITFDPAYDTKGRHRRTVDPWMMQLPCRFGVIYPHGGNLLAVEVDCHPKVAKALGAISGVVLYLDGDGEKTFLFPVDLFDQVAEVVKPYRRRQWTEEARRDVAERLARFQFGSVVDPQETAP